MAAFNRNDLGAGASTIMIQLDASNDPKSCRVAIQLTDGSTLIPELTLGEAGAALTAGERAAFRSGLPKLYAAAVAKAGGV
jgi:hypothetical protein